VKAVHICSLQKICSFSKTLGVYTEDFPKSPNTSPLVSQRCATSQRACEDFILKSYTGCRPREIFGPDSVWIPSYKRHLASSRQLNKTLHQYEFVLASLRRLSGRLFCASTRHPKTARLDRQCKHGGWLAPFAHEPKVETFPPMSGFSCPIRTCAHKSKGYTTLQIYRQEVDNRPRQEDVQCTSASARNLFQSFSKVQTHMLCDHFGEVR
jgi:hypothetical protein